MGVFRTINVGRRTTGPAAPCAESLRSQICNLKVSFTVRPPLNQNYTLVSFSTRRDVIGRLVKYWMGCGLALCCIYNTTSLAIAQGNESVSPQRRDFEAAKQEYERSPRDEAARLTYVTKLARMADPLVAEYRQSGRRHDELMTLINSEWQKHPAPRDIDSKKLRKLLVGKWDLGNAEPKMVRYRVTGESKAID
jgi:hypothetical protein